MLGTDSFSFETPNVIDPGDAPPSQPARKVKTPPTAPSSPTEGASLLDPGDDEDYQRSRQSPQRLLRDIDDLQLAPSQPDPSTEASYDPYHGEDEEAQKLVGNGRRGARASGRQQHSLPSVEEARTYAVSLLNNSDWKDRQGPSSQDPFARTVPISATRAAASNGGGASSRSSKHLVRQRLTGLAAKACVVLLVVIILILLTLLGVRTAQHVKGTDKAPAKADDMPPAPRAVTRLEQTLNYIHSTLVTDPADLISPGTPQYKAANWLANLDPLQYTVPTNNSAPEAVNFVQRYVLATLYYSTEGANWPEQLNFLSDQNECAWFNNRQLVGYSNEEFAIGASCNFDLEVVNLFMPSNGLKGSIPSELVHLTALELLAFPHNGLTGTIPTNLGVLEQLEYVDFKFNDLHGTIPDIFESLPYLAVLGLSNNVLEDELPPSLGTLARLQTLAIDDNLLTGSLDVLSALTELQYLYADRNVFTAILDEAFLADLTRIREIDISQNALECSNFPASLLQHDTLEILDLAGNQLAGSLPQNLAENVNLKFLSLRNNQLSGRLRDSGLPMLRRLKHLDLSHNRLTHIPPNELANLERLEILFLGNNLFDSHPIPNWIFELKNLQELGLSNMQLTLDVPFWLEELSSLMFLDLSSNLLTGNIPTEVFALPNLVTLLLHNNTLTGNVPGKVESDLPFMQVLTLHDNPGIYGDMNDICDQSPKLEFFATDCRETVICSLTCCPRCCDRTAGADSCFQQELPTYVLFYEGLWELNFTRAAFSFDPAILTDATDPDSLIHQQTVINDAPP